VYSTGDVSFRHRADIGARSPDVCFWPKAEIAIVGLNVRLDYVPSPPLAGDVNLVDALVRKI